MTTGDTNPLSEERPTLPIGRLGWVFLKIGLTAFGGLGAALALIDRVVVTKL